MTDDDTSRPADDLPGHDASDPYAEADLSAYPDWWRENVETFRAHGMGPYRPPQFSDGAVVTEVVEDLEGGLGVAITLRKHIGAEGGSAWRVSVDGEVVTELERLRTEEGRSVYSVTSDAFEQAVREAATE